MRKNKPLDESHKTGICYYANDYQLSRYHITCAMIYAEEKAASIAKKIPPSTQFDGCPLKFFTISDFSGDDKIAGPL
ncbi:hypothetical protein HanPI659440_Chr15g0592141 [Helianthus annuus]|nr:hypothetical protein HanPI659440_Chr15g0592141 [Helianthus annuus]